MGKIPVGTTIRYAYGFAFGHLGAIIAQIWLPMLLVTAGGYFVASPYYESFSRAAAENNPSAIGQAFVLLVLFAFVALIFYAMIYVAVTRLALGEPARSGYFHFSLGGPEWRMYGAILGLAFVLFVLVIVIGLLAGLIAGIIAGAAKALGAANPQSITGILASAAMLVLYAAILYFAVRLAFFFAPVTVAEERISLARGWQLGKGNFWRMLGVLAATLLPIIVLMIVCEAAIVGTSAVLPHASKDLAQMAAHMEEMRSHLPMLYGLSFVFSPFLFGLTLGASAFAYRTLVPPPAGRPVLSAAA